MRADRAFCSLLVLSGREFRSSKRLGRDPEVLAFKEAGGEGGIRTLDRVVRPYNGLANRRLQPLGHLSGVWNYSLPLAAIRLVRAFVLAALAGARLLFPLIRTAAGALF